MSFFIFVEGPDGAGKTTFIDGLVKKIGKNLCDVKHFGVPENPDTQLGIYISELMKTTKPVVIFDRCWYSDMVYGPIMRNELKIPTCDSLLLENYVKHNGGGMVYYLSSDTNTLWNRCETRGEDYVKNIHQLKKIAAAYAVVMETVTLPLVRVVT